jgi:hypothetical protein
LKEVEITTKLINKAKEKAKDLGKLRNSITNGKGNLVGFLGEEVALSCLGGKLTNTYDYDLVLEDGTKVDVKTKSTTVAPLPYYDCSVAAYNTKQKCDAYAFVRVKKDLTKAWYLGILPKNTYFELAERFDKGDIDPANGFIIKADCYNVKISELQDSI